MPPNKRKKEENKQEFTTITVPESLKDKIDGDYRDNKFEPYYEILKRVFQNYDELRKG